MNEAPDEVDPRLGKARLMKITAAERRALLLYRDNPTDAATEVPSEMHRTLERKKLVRAKRRGKRRVEGWELTALAHARLDGREPQRKRREPHAIDKARWMAVLAAVGRAASEVSSGAATQSASDNQTLMVLMAMPLTVAKRLVADAFEHLYLTRVMGQAGTSILGAARRADVDRTNFRRLLQQHGLYQENGEP